jgi:NADH-ubiquinone oxidoreductase chain 4L
MNITFILFLIRILGFVFNRKNIILILISIEIMLSSITFLILLSSLNTDDILSQISVLYLIVVAGAESAIGLGVLVVFHKEKFTYSSVKNQSKSILNLLPGISPSNIVRSLPSRNYSSLAGVVPEASESNINSLNPYYVAGLADGEGSFFISIYKSSARKVG